MLITLIWIFFNPVAPCHKKLSDELSSSKDKIILLEKVNDVNQETINNLQEQITRRDEDLKAVRAERKELFQRWNTSDSYINYLQDEFLRRQALVVEDLRVVKEKTAATDAVLEALAMIQKDNRAFFLKVLDKVTDLSELQASIVKETHQTHKNTLQILQDVIKINTRMQNQIDDYGENQKFLIGMVKNMTNDESKLWSIIHSLRSAIAELEEEQRLEINEIVDKQNESVRLLITALLELVSQDDIWQKLNNDTLSENLEKLRMVRYAMDESLKMIRSENSTLAMNLQHSFETKLDELKEQINWKDDQSMEQWVEEPKVKSKMMRDLRNKALSKINEIKLDGLDAEELEKAQIRLEELKIELNNQDLELMDMMNKKIEVDQLQKKYEKMFTDHQKHIDDIGNTKFNVTIDVEKYIVIGGMPERSDTPRAKAISYHPNDMQTDE